MSNKPQIFRKKYDTLLKDLKAILDKGLTHAYKAVDNIKVQTYWQLGERIVREELDNKHRADYGKKIVENLAKDLEINERTLYRAIKFFSIYPILTTVSSQLSWSHYKELIQIKNDESRHFFESQIIRERWSVRELRQKIKSNEYKKFKKKGKILTITQQNLPSPEDIFKESYDWDFLSLDEKHTEIDLENALLDNIQKVLLEFGSGFAFLGRQHKILINNKWHKIDLLFYHVLLKCYIIIELKARELKQGDIEQVTKYLTYFRKHKIDSDKDPIALIICKSHNEIDVYYSAGKNKSDIFVAEYQSCLPSEQEIKSRLEVK